MDSCIFIFIAASLAVAAAHTAHAQHDIRGEFASETVTWCRTSDDTSAVRVDATAKEAVVYSVVPPPSARALGRATWAVRIPEISPDARGQFALLRGGRRLVVIPHDGYTKPRTDIAIVVLDRDTQPVQVSKHRFATEEVRAARETGDCQLPPSDWLDRVVELKDDRMVLQTLDDAIFAVDLTNGETALLPAHDRDVPVGDSVDLPLCSYSFAATAPPPVYVCPATGAPPLPPAGIPELRLCDHAMPTIVSDSHATRTVEGEPRRIVIAMFGLEYRLIFDSQSPPPPDEDGNSVFSLTPPHEHAIMRADERSLRLARGVVEGEDPSSVTAFVDSSGVLSLDVVTPSDNTYVTRAEFLLGPERASSELLAYRRSDFAIVAPRGSR